MSSNWDIINNKATLTEQEFNQIYNNLLKDDVYVLQVEDPNKFYSSMRDKLNFMSKSAKNVYCERQFKYERILNIKPTIYPDDTLQITADIGKNIHSIADSVWNLLDIDKIRRIPYYEDIAKHIHSKCMLLLPDPINAVHVYSDLLDNYAHYEAFRIMNIINELGNVDSIYKYIPPIHRELSLINIDTGQRGIIDDINREITDEYSITDYKSGSPKHHDSYIDESGEVVEPDKYDIKAIEFEITDYHNLLQGDNIYKINKKYNNYSVTELLNNKSDCLTKFESIDVSSGRLLYIQDWSQTCKLIPITIEMINESANLDKRIVDIVNKAVFYRRLTIHCSQYCKFFYLCKQSLEYDRKLAKIDPNIVDAFNMFTGDKND